MKTNKGKFEIEMKLELQNTLDIISHKFKTEKLDIIFKYMKEESLFLQKQNVMTISKDYIENYYYCLYLYIKEFQKQNTDPKLMILENTFKILAKKKIITPHIKEELLSLGFKEVTIGSKEIHEINSKELKFDFFGYEIAIGIFARCISYGCNRLYRALVYTF